MKTNSILLILFFACTATLAQTSSTGIAVQGIARDANKAAIAGKTLTFKFTVSGTPSGGSEIKYEETQEITTDAFGVFSHIIGTGTSSGTFANMPFGKAHMTLKVEANGIQLMNTPFQYSPYAKNADNGVPVGGIIMWSGSVAPEGWALCNGQTVEGVQTPDLRGRFVIGMGQNGSPAAGDSNPTYALNSAGGKNEVIMTVQQMPSHTHNVQWAGSHRHAFWSGIGNGSLEADDADQIGFGAFSGTYANPQSPNPYQRDGVWQSRGTDHIEDAGWHNHTIDNTGDGNAQENRPPYYVLAYIIRLR